MIWKLAEAKNKFSEVVRRALHDGPQRIERRGREAVVLLSACEFERLSGLRPDFIEYLSTGPDLGELNLERDRSAMRELDL